jgi:hypothetical protein
MIEVLLHDVEVIIPTIYDRFVLVRSREPALLGWEPLNKAIVLSSRSQGSPAAGGSLGVMEKSILTIGTVTSNLSALLNSGDHAALLRGYS